MNDMIKKPVVIHLMAVWTVTGLNLLIYALMSLSFPEQEMVIIYSLVFAGLIAFAVYLETTREIAIKAFRVMSLLAVAYSVGVVAVGILTLPEEAPAYRSVEIAIVCAPITAVFAVLTFRQSFLEQAKKYRALFEIET
jgi:hypothetical protein